MVGGPQRSMRCSTNGGVPDPESRSKGWRVSARSIGCSASISKQRHISKRFPSALARDYERSNAAGRPTSSPRRATASVIRRSRRSRRSRPTRFTRWSSPVRADNDRARAKRSSACAHARGASCIGSIPTSSTRTSRTLGAASPKTGELRLSSRRPPATKCTLLQKQRLRLGIQKLRPQQSFASNGCSAPRTSWPATSGGRITEGREAPDGDARIFHHKTGAVVLHPLQDSDGTLFYADAEGVLATVPRRGIPMILHETRGKTEPGKAKPTKLYSGSGMAKLVRRLRKEAALPVTFTLNSVGMAE